MSRLATLSQGGKTLTYSRLTNSDRLDKAEFSPASAAPAVEYSYDAKLRLISKGCGTRYFTDKDEVWYFDCPAGTPGNWGTSRYYFYDAMGQLSRAGDGAMGPNGELNNPQNFSYDSIGNHLTNNETYNILNQGSGKTYDANGNMTANGSNWIALYDGENRLRTVSHPYEGVELLYDYAGRIYQVNDFYMDGGLPPTSTLNYRRIYDGTKLIATVRNGEIEDTFVWQPETSGDADVILWDNSYVYATDPNKNVRVKRFPNDWIPGTWVEEFIDYKPFGELKNYVANPPRFMFSSEEYMSETGMYHYLYRAYSPSLARFITRDPIEEQGGVNLYCFVNNNPVSYWDKFGLDKRENIVIEKSQKRCLLNGGSEFYLTFDGLTLKSSLGDFSVPAYSGVPINKQTETEIINITDSNIIPVLKVTTTSTVSFNYSVERQKLKNIGGIPAGNYRIYVNNESRSSISEIFSDNKRFSLRMFAFSDSWGNYAWPLYPESDTQLYDRKGFFIHGGKNPGSAGCIDILENDKQLSEYLDGLCFCYIPVKVDYAVTINTISYKSIKYISIWR